jgi:peptidoglycan/LPS O-acetylase OafA/YrhL
LDKHVAGTAWINRLAHAITGREYEALLGQSDSVTSNKGNEEMQRINTSEAGTDLIVEREIRQVRGQRHPATSSETPHRIPSLDGLRGISIWAVIIAHSADHFLFSRIHSHHVRTVLSNFANLGVTIFFVISGFLITSILLAERTRTSRINIRRFYKKRAIRIIPAFVLFTGTILLLCHVNPRQIAYAVTFTTSFFFWQAYKPLQHLWSLSVEEQFYLAWPLIFARGTGDAKRWCWAVLIACPVIRAILVHQGFVYLDHAALLDSVAAGCLLAFYRERVQRAIVRVSGSGVVFAAFCLMMPLLSLVVNKVESFSWLLVPLTTSVPLFVAVVIGAAIERRDAFLNKGPLVWSGLLSYSLYLWQQPFLVMNGPLNYFVVRLGLTFAAAYCSYRWVEQPIIHFFAGRDKRAGRVSLPIEKQTTTAVS